MHSIGMVGTEKWREAVGETRSVYPVAIALKGDKVAEQTKEQKQR